MSDEKTQTTLMDWPTFGLGCEEKQNFFLPEMRRLTAHHMSACAPYADIIKKFGYDTDNIETLPDIPFLPVRLFKQQRLLSVPDAEVVKTMTSSGTSGQSPSQIFLDKTTSSLQVKVLSRIMTDFIGPKRLPLLVIDCEATVANRKRFSARTAGILGFSMFGRNVTYALDDDMSLNTERVQAFLDKHKDQDILVFGFTYIVWLHFVKALEQSGRTLDVNKGVLIHGGGWKQLADQAISTTEYKDRIANVCGMTRLHNYYGMVEQTGSIFMECEHGHLHASAWSDIVIRDPIDFSPLSVGESGLIELLSVLPHSYPGHALLSEDMGTILGHDDCACGRKGVYFEVKGRLEQAEVRGCSDTYSR
ncbi:long-chain fatty acid--CoA ligase [Magnetovibrio sp. PR-2]|uniref:LuxE/PaaK family acyltransferase n=1 Tax=Magnetovibrio sp. PR-2 TaxID=3120356 RepID=UPI002FCE1F9D